MARNFFKKVRKADGVYFKGEEKHYTQEQLLETLAIIDMPSGFVDHQLEKFKANIRGDRAKELSQKGKEARGTQVQTWTTGLISYARKKYIFGQLPQGHVHDSGRNDTNIPSP